MKNYTNNYKCVMKCVSPKKYNYIDSLGSATDSWDVKMYKYYSNYIDVQDAVQIILYDLENTTGALTEFSKYLAEKDVYKAPTSFQVLKPRFFNLVTEDSNLSWSTFNKMRSIQRHYELFKSEEYA